mmetsp:Transcript_146190/g.272166  ORF Transcript_146190/g.272166 Transcript_146190/m.272166 type:complete len:84 (-) Transcript_146190:102-353(-)
MPLHCGRRDLSKQRCRSVRPCNIPTTSPSITLFAFVPIELFVGLLNNIVLALNWPDKNSRAAFSHQFSWTETGARLYDLKYGS